MLRKGDYPKATVCILRSLSLNPYNINALNNLGVAYASVGKIAEAIQAWENSIRIWPDHMEAHKNLGTVYALKGEKEKAIYHFQLALRLSPEDLQAREALRILALGAGRSK